MNHEIKEKPDHEDASSYDNSFGQSEDTLQDKKNVRFALNTSDLVS